MNIKAVTLGIIVLVIAIAVGIFFIQKTPSTVNLPHLASKFSPSEVKRQVAEYAISPSKTIDVEASKVPSFTIDVSNSKFEKILSANDDELKKLVSVNISHDIRTEDINATVTTDPEKKVLMINASDVPHFKPGLYKVSITLRTLEGEVNIDQNFAWGVLAVNTKKSVYSPGEKVDIGLGVLDDAGTTQCLTGFNHLKTLSMTITTPAGTISKYDISDGTIKDSGMCTANSVTNEADFKAIFADTKNSGIYQIYVEATVKGEKRSITDYFKVDPNVSFDVERTSFPTRIYPYSPYPVTFTVTSKKDFNGEITDVFPSFFVIKNATDHPVLEQFGDFTKIKWNVKLQAGIPRQFTYFIYFPHVSPEFYLIGPMKIGDFTEARQWQIASDAINSTSGLVSLEDNGGPNTWSRIWTGTTWSPLMPTPPVSMSTTPTDSRWFREISSPKTGEKIVGIIDNDTSPNDPIYIFTWDGSSWGGGTPSVTIASVSTSADVTRPFDIAYEELSGDVLLLYSDYSTSQLHYRLKPAGGAWPGSSSNAGTAFDTYKRWVRLQGQFGSDQILAGYLNNNEHVGAMIWDGSTDTFGNQFADNVGTATSNSNDAAFDIAWETQSGTPMIFWGSTGNDLIYREFTGGAWSSETSAATGFTNDLAWVKAGADPISLSNNISIAMQDSTTCRARFAIWTGSSLTVNATVPTCASAATNNLIDTAFENDTGQAMYVYVSSATTNQISWLTWTSGGGFTSATTEAGTTTNIEGVQLYSDLNTTSMVLLYHDNSGSGSDCQLWDREWDGSSWSAKRASPVFAAVCASADNDTEPYGFGFDRNLEKQVAYRWFANSGTVAVSTPIGTQDTPALLTSANQQFRLRLLIYTSDTLSTSLRDYKLQYVDPGSGTCDSPSGGTPSTWTDVPTSGGSTISFYNNATPADGDNLTANGTFDPTYGGFTVRNQDYEEANNFTNTVASIGADELGMWDFSLVDNTTFDRDSQTYCFRVARTSNVVLRIGIYPQISTAAVDDVLLQGGSDINQGTSINNP